MRFWALLATIFLFACAPVKTTVQREQVVEQPVVMSNDVKEEPSTENPPAEEPLVTSEDFSSDVLVEKELEPEIEQEPAPEPVQLTPEEEKVLQTKTDIQFDLDVYETKEMQLYFKYYTHKHRKTFARWLKRAQDLLPFIKEIFTAQGLPQDLIFLPFAESGFNPWAYSRAGAAGLWQFMPSTGRKYGLKVDWWIDERRDPYLSTYAAARYLKKLYNDFGDWYLALAAYNAGEGRIAWALRRSGCNNFFDLARKRRYLRKETKHYVPKFLAILKIVQNLEELGFEPIDWNREPQVEKLKVNGGTDLLALAGAININWKEFRKLNPAFRRQVSPPDKECFVYIPKEKLQLAKAYLDNPQSRPYAGYKRYKIRRGDSWWRISRRFGVPIAVLKKVNNKRSNLLKPGYWIMVPAKGADIIVYNTNRVRALARERANYIVQKGDTLWDISNRFGISLKTLIRANGITSAKSLRPGQKLYIPDASYKQTQLARQQAKTVHARLVEYRVRKGDTLWDIARKFAVRTSDLVKWNGLPKRGIIHPGDKLKIYVP
ncbi:LysM peptidoglycan-binding domain-containing protein [Desulfovulcanus sp.]